MIVSNGSGGVHIEDGVAESTLRAVMKNCCRSVLDHWEDFGEEQ